MVPVAARQQAVVLRVRRLVLVDMLTDRLMVVKRVCPSVSHSYAVMAIGTLL
jgi:hypothetical protein